MEELIWRKEGERCERSYRSVETQTQAQQTQAQQTQAQQTQAQQTQAQQTQAPQTQAQQTQAQYDDINYINKHESEGFGQNNNNNNNNNKREQANDKINERFLIGKSIQNPFMTSNTYMDDIENQMNFLTPQKSNI